MENLKMQREALVARIHENSILANEGCREAQYEAVRLEDQLVDLDREYAKQLRRLYAEGHRLAPYECAIAGLPLSAAGFVPLWQTSRFDEPKPQSNRKARMEPVQVPVKAPPTVEKPSGAVAVKEKEEKKMTLYEINAAILSCMKEVVDAETGEITEEVIDTEALEALQLVKSEKVEGICCWIKDLFADAKAMKIEEERLYQRRKAAEKKAESLRGYLEATCNGERFKGIRAEVSFRPVSSVAVDDMSLLPEQFVRTKITKEPDKIALKKVLANTEIPGAHLETRLSATIR